MRFLFINQYYSPDYAATAQQLSDLCESIAEAGHEVHVLTSRALYDGRDIELPAEEVLNGVHVHRVGLSNKGRNSLRDRLIGYLSFYVRAFTKAHFLPRADVVVTLTTPPMISLLGTWLRVLRKSRFVYWVMDIYPDIALNAGVLSRVGPTRGIWSALGRISYLTANRVVVLGSDMKRILSKKGVRESKIDVVQSWFCAEDIRPVPACENGFRKEFCDGKDFTLMYSGNMGTCHTFRSVAEGIQLLEERNGDDRSTQFLFVGGGKKKPWLMEQLGKLTERVKFLPYQDRSELDKSLTAPDAHLITLEPKYDGLLVPSKLYGIMAAGRAVLFVGSDNNEVARILRESRCGVRVDPDNAEAFAAAVRELASDPDETRAMGERGRAYFERHFERRWACERFLRMLEDEARRPGVRGVRSLAHHAVRRVVNGPGYRDSGMPEKVLESAK
ncbi:MAG: glycosyltransferase family 4 protein [Sumerlaeia bacterium]